MYTLGVCKLKSLNAITTVMPISALPVRKTLLQKIGQNATLFLSVSIVIITFSKLAWYSALQPIKTKIQNIKFRMYTECIYLEIMWFCDIAS